MPGQKVSKKEGAMNRIRELKKKYGALIHEAAEKYLVPEEIVGGVIWAESRGNPRAVSHCGAKGLMQLMPATARRFGVKDVFDPAQNIDGGVKYLRWLLIHFKGNVDLILAGYNAGEGNVKKYGMKIPPFKETRNYVVKVQEYADQYRALIADDFHMKIAEKPEPTFLPEEPPKKKRKGNKYRRN